MVGQNNQDIGVVGSPSSTTELTVDLLQEAVEDRLIGALLAFNATQNGSPITSVGQVVGIELRNRWHEDATFRNLIKRTGEIPPITSRQDTRTAQFIVGATFKGNAEGYDPDLLGMVPSTGTRMVRVDQPLLDSLLSVYSKEVFYLGRAYANDVRFPMWFKHFGSSERGAGEAYHAGVFGKTGSGKSGLAKMLLLAYARHQKMGILIVDPQGEFSSELVGKMFGQQHLPVKGILDALGRNAQLYNIQDLQLDGWDFLEELLVVLGFTRQALGIPSASFENAETVAKVIRESLEGSVRLDSLNFEPVFVKALQAVTDQYNALRIYSTKSRADQLISSVTQVLNGPRRAQTFQGSWGPIAAMFSAKPGKRTLVGIVRDLVGDPKHDQRVRSIVAIDLSEQGNREFWTEDLQHRLIRKLLDALRGYATGQLDTTDGANVLVILDEAHRLAPSGSLERGSEAEQLRNTLRRAVRETRKFGIGWFFISQTLGGIDNEILQQLRMLFFGFGLALGDEFSKLRDFAGGDKRSMDLYQSFRDPASAPRPDLREFPFMAVGPVSPLSFSGRPLFFSAFSDAEEFIKANGLPMKQRLM